MNVNVKQQIEALIRLRGIALNRKLDSISIVVLAITIISGAGLYGATIGFWRSPLQALYSSIKFPLIIFLTVLSTTAANGLLAQVWGMQLGFLRGFKTVLTAFAVTSIILGALSPVLFFLAYNIPPYTSDNFERHYGIIRLIHVLVVAVAGVVGTSRLREMLQQQAPSAFVAKQVLFLWLGFNLFVGAQLSWVFRPFIGSPLMQTQFLRADPMRGNFYEEVWKSTVIIMEER